MYCMLFMSISYNLAVMTLLSSASPGVVIPITLVRSIVGVRRSVSQLSYTHISGWSWKFLAFSTSQTSPLQSEKIKVDRCEGTLPTGPRLESIKALEIIFKILRNVRFGSGHGTSLGNYVGHVLQKMSGQEPNQGARSSKWTQASVSQDWFRKTEGWRDWVWHWRVARSQVPLREAASQGWFLQVLPLVCFLPKAETWPASQLCHRQLI